MEKPALSLIDRLLVTPAVGHDLYDKGEFVYKAGEPARNIHLLKSGIILTRQDNVEESCISDIVRAGEIFGIDSLHSPERYTSAQADTEVEIATIPVRKLAAICSAYPKMALPFFQLLAEAYRRLEEHNTVIKNGQAKNKIASALIEFSEGQDINVQHWKLAARTSINRVTATKVMAELAEEGLILATGLAQYKILEEKSFTELAHPKMKLVDRNIKRNGQE